MADWDSPLKRTPLRRTPPRGLPIPSSGAWRHGMPAGHRQFKSISNGRPFALEGGGSLSEVTIAYETWGQLNDDASNAVLVCHALTGDSHVAGKSGNGHPTGGWWDDLVGPGRPLDTDRYFVVCSNVLGGCQGSTGPSSPHPDDGQPYGSRFPVVTIRDMVRSQQMLATSLGVSRWLSVIGGSMGGMQAIEWACMFPEQVGSLVSLASCAAASPLQIGWSEVGRLAIAQDVRWNDGDYYDADDGDGPHEGLMLARRVAQIHYRADESYQNRFGRSFLDGSDRFALWSRFQIESYLDYPAEIETAIRRQHLPHSQQEGDGPARHRPRSQWRPTGAAAGVVPHPGGVGR
ncbi:MAG: homoserine O-acetyltransferase [Acidimicrobiales bacterium]